MTHPSDDFDLEAFNQAFAKEFGETLADDPEVDPPVEERFDPLHLITMVLTPVADARILARLMGLVDIAWPVFPTKTGAVAATVFELDEVSALTDTTPQEAITVAKALSNTSEFGVVLLTARVGKGEDGATGQVHATRYVGGEQVETLSPGVVLAGADTTVENVIFGHTAPDQVKGALNPLDVARDVDPDSDTPKRRWGRKPR